MEGQTFHAQRVEEVLPDVFAVGHARGGLDDRGHHVVAEAVLEMRAGIEVQRLGGQRVGDLPGGHVGRVLFPDRPARTARPDRSSVPPCMDIEMPKRHDRFRRADAAVFPDGQMGVGGQIYLLTGSSRATVPRSTSCMDAAMQTTLDAESNGSGLVAGHRLAGTAHAHAAGVDRARAPATRAGRSRECPGRAFRPDTDPMPQNSCVIPPLIWVSDPATFSIFPLK